MLCAAIGVACVVAIKVFESPAWIPVSPPRSVGGQLAYLLRDPTAVFRIAAATLRQSGAFYYASFVGILGWLDAGLARSYYQAAGIVLCLCFIAIALGRDQFSSETNAQRCLLLIPVIVAIALMFAALYVTWTPVGQLIVEGVQGRYFLGFLPLLALAVPTTINTSKREINGVEALRSVSLLGVALFPLYSFVEIIHVIIQRFYLQ